MNTVDLIPALILGGIFGYFIGYLVYHSISCKHCADIHRRGLMATKGDD